MKTFKQFIEDIKVPIKIGDTVLGGKFKNKRIVVKSIGKNAKGDITINGKSILRVRVINEAVTPNDFKRIKDKDIRQMFESLEMMYGITKYLVVINNHNYNIYIKDIVIYQKILEFIYKHNFEDDLHIPISRTHILRNNNFEIMMVQHSHPSIRESIINEMQSVKGPGWGDNLPDKQINKGNTRYNQKALLDIKRHWDTNGKDYNGKFVGIIGGKKRGKKLHYSAIHPTGEGTYITLPDISDAIWVDEQEVREGQIKMYSIKKEM